MAYYERSDETLDQVLCNICNVKCNERSILAHKSKCAIKHPDKFKTGGLLRRCQFDSGHIIEADKYELHLEFCNKRQMEILSEYQRAIRQNAIAIGPAGVIEPANTSIKLMVPSSVGDDWNQEANNDTFTHKMSKLNIGTK